MSRIQPSKHSSPPWQQTQQPPVDAVGIPASPAVAPAGDAKKAALTRWVQRFGVAGFMFFLIKGLLWLTVPALLAYWGSR